MSRSSAALSLAVVVCLLAAVTVSCSKSKSSTSPGYGTTGGGGGAAPPVLNGNLAPTGGSYAHMFNTAGTFNYHCTIHPSCTGLAGTIVVVAAATGIQNRQLAISQSGGVYGTCSALSVSRDTVHVGDTVTWTNNSPVQHTVVSQ